VPRTQGAKILYFIVEIWNNTKNVTFTNKKEKKRKAKQ